MFEKIRISLWDVFSFFLSGLLLVMLATATLVLYADSTSISALRTVPLPSDTIVALASPAILVILGMLLEPIANYVDLLVLNRFPAFIKDPRKEKHTRDEKALEDEIKRRHLALLDSEPVNTFAFCKDYLDAREVNSPYMAFLSRYGFYRNCAFLFLCAFVIAISMADTNCQKAAHGTIALTCCLAFKRRAAEFYLLLAPTVFRAFVIDRLFIRSDFGTNTATDS